MGRPSQKLAATKGNMAAGFPPVAVTEEVLPLERLMDTLTLGASPLELQEDPTVVQAQGAPMASHLQIPTVAPLLGLMDKGLLQAAPLPMWTLRRTPGSSQWTLITVATSLSRS